MADTEPTAEQQNETPQIAVPSHTPLPPPPAVSYTRPHTHGGAPVRPQAGKPFTPAETGSGEASGSDGHGAGMAAGFTFASSLIGGALLGNWIDGHWVHSSTPWATLVMTLLGATAGFLNMTRILSRGSRTKDKK